MSSSTSYPDLPDVAALEVIGLSGPRGWPLLSDVNVRVPAGTTHIILGPIHCGKSLLLRHIVGLELAEQGSIVVEGMAYDATRIRDQELRRLRSRLGVVFEGSALLSRLSVIENVELPLLEHTVTRTEEARDTARKLLAEVGLSVSDDATPEYLGRAEKRRVALARALALRPAVLLLDEPALGLDRHAAAELDDTIERLQASHGFGVVIFSHEVRYAFRRADEISVMADGVIVERGDGEALQRSVHPVVRQLVHRRGRS